LIQFIISLHQVSVGMPVSFTLV